MKHDTGMRQGRCPPGAGASPFPSPHPSFSKYFQIPPCATRNDYADVLFDLQTLSHLAPDWDSYGSSPPDKGILDKAEAFLLSLPTGTPSPSVVPVSGGGVQFEWYEDCYLEIEFQPNGGIEYLGVLPDGILEEGQL